MENIFYPKIRKKILKKIKSKKRKLKKDRKRLMNRKSFLLSQKNKNLFWRKERIAVIKKIQTIKVTVPVLLYGFVALRGSITLRVCCLEHCLSQCQNKNDNLLYRILIHNILNYLYCNLITGEDAGKKVPLPLQRSLLRRQYHRHSECPPPRSSSSFPSPWPP